MLKLKATDGHELDFWMQPATSNRRGGLVLLQEIFGITDQLKGVAERYASLGYDVAIPALFDRQKRGTVLAFDDAVTGAGLMKSAKLDETLLDILAAVLALKEQGDKVAVMGFCWGGGLAIRAAQKLDISAAVSFYGTRLPQYLDCPLKAPVMGHFGLSDSHVPPEMLQQAQDYLPDMQVHTYAAGHAFANDRRAAVYDQASAEKAHDRSAAFLAQHLS
ncbi:MAG: dienelactone hydrolase [Rhodobacteraceae bacterium]|nr:MAG: dienelactone hydrolase [Paracoccaceae bacterium]